MNSLHFLLWAIRGVMALNCSVFVVAALRSFDGRFVTWRTRASGGSFLACTAVATFALWRSPTLDPARLALGAVGLIVSELVFASAWQAMRSRPLTAIGSGDLPRHVLQRGVYRRVRHPFYASYILTFVAAACASDSPWAALAAAYLTGMYAFAARAEEQKFATTSLSAEYAAYRQQAGMMWPRLFAGSSQRGLG